MATELTLPDGRRAIAWSVMPEDRAAIREGYEALSPESRYHRFLSGVPHLTDQLLDHLVGEVDGVDHVALVLFVINAKGNLVRAMTLYGEAAKLLELAADAQGAERPELAARSKAILNAATEIFDRGYADYVEAQTTAGTFAPPAPGLPAPTGAS